MKEENNNLKLQQEKQLEKQKQDFEKKLIKKRTEMNKIKKESNDIRLGLKKQIKSFEEEITKMKTEIIEIQENNSKERLTIEINQLKMYLKKTKI